MDQEVNEGVRESLVKSLSNKATMSLTMGSGGMDVGSDQTVSFLSMPYPG